MSSGAVRGGRILERGLFLKALEHAGCTEGSNQVCEVFPIEFPVSCVIKNTEQLVIWNNHSVLVSCV